MNSGEARASARWWGVIGGSFLGVLAAGWAGGGPAAAEPGAAGMPPPSLPTFRLLGVVSRSGDGKSLSYTDMTSLDPNGLPLTLDANNRLETGDFVALKLRITTREATPKTYVALLGVPYNTTDVKGCLSVEIEDANDPNKDEVRVLYGAMILANGWPALGTPRAWVGPEAIIQPVAGEETTTPLPTMAMHSEPATSSTTDYVYCLDDGGGGFDVEYKRPTPLPSPATRAFSSYDCYVKLANNSLGDVKAVRDDEDAMKRYKFIQQLRAVANMN